MLTNFQHQVKLHEQNMEQRTRQDAPEHQKQV